MGREVCLLAAALAAAGCGSAPSGTGTPNGTAASTAAGSAAASGIGSPTSDPAGFVAGPGTFSVADPATGLAGLGTFRAQLTRTFTGAAGGSSGDWSVTIERTHDADRRADTLDVSTTGAASEKPGRVVAIGGVVYTVAAGRDCVGGVIDGADAIWTHVEPARSLPGIVGAEAAGTDTVGGLDADHFTFDERAVGLAGVAEASGELWTASSGGQLLKYSLRVEGGPEYFGGDVVGTVTWAYELLDVNAPIDIEVPEGCPAGLVDAPTLPDAASVVSGAGLLAYTTTADITAVMSFYEGRAKELGWTRTGEPLSDEEIGVLEYSSSDGAVTVFIQAEGGTTTVRIVVDPGAGG